MKRYYILTTAVVLAMVMTACIHEEFEAPNKLALDKEDFAFSIGKSSTKASVGESGSVRSFKLGNSGFYMQETVESLDMPTASTKGTPIYTENIESYYSQINVVGYKKGNGTPIVSGDNSSFDFFATSDNGSRKVYRKSIPAFWNRLGNDEDLWFFLTAPVQSSASGPVSNIEYGYGADNSSIAEGAIAFDYTTPATAREQKDLLLTSSTFTKGNYFDDPDYLSQGGVPVTFYHALTGVKFRNGHNNNHSTKTIITGVKISGLKSTGHCIINPAAENIVVWSNTGNVTDFTETSFDNPEYVPASAAANPDGTIDYSENDGFGASWTSAAASNNLNDEDGSLTFWFIPQDLNENVTMEVTFVIKTPDTPNPDPITHTIELGKMLAKEETQTVGEETTVTYTYPKWKAGELRTYSLRPLDVDVEVMDDMKEEGDYVVKYNLHVANTGNVDEYVRMLVMGNWYGWKSEASKLAGDAPSILVGYTSDDVSDNEMVKPWYSGGYDGVDPYGEFDSSFTLGKLGTRDGKRNDWADASGGYYFTMPIGPGEGAGEDAVSATKALFESYTLKNVPTIYLADRGVREPAYGVHLVMEIVIQAIPVPQGDDVWWLQAWYDATGIDKLNPELDRNATYLSYYNSGEYNPGN